MGDRQETAPGDCVDLSIVGDVAVLTIRHPPVNALSHAVRSGLQDLVAACGRDGRCRAIVLIGDGNTFPAGADIREFGRPIEPPMLNAVNAAIEASPVPVVAAIHGTALGGGLELAMACHQRIAVTTARLGLPEVRLGVMPGGGGTQRLPRLVGIGKALEMTLTGEPIGAAEAAAAGLVDRVVDGDLLEAAIRHARECAGRPVAPQLVRNREANLTHHDPAIFDDWRRRIAERNGGEVAPVEILKSVHNSISLPFDEASRQERAGVAACLASPQAGALRYLFFAEREVRKVSGVAVPARPVRRLALVGAEASSPFVRAAGESGLEIVRRDPEGSAADLASADMVLVVRSGGADDVPGLVGLLDRVAAGTPVAIAEPLPDVDVWRARSVAPERIFGLRCLAGPGCDAVGMIEIVSGRVTTQAALSAGFGLARALGRPAIVVGGSGEAVIGRMLDAYVARAEALVRSGIDAEAVDHALCAFGMRRGPFGTSGMREAVAADASGIAACCLAAAVNEGAKLLEVGLIERAGDIDVAWANGLGFPRHLGGPLYWADTTGLETILKTLETGCRQGSGLRPAPLLAALARTGQPLHRYRRPKPDA